MKNMNVIFRQRYFCYFPPFSAKVVIYSQIYKIGRPFIEYNRFVSIDENPSFKQIFFLVEIGEKIFGFFVNVNNVVKSV
ncbi:hypothetical protein CN470_06550 [Bacillus cereus]|uniref:hypothetical protein n=1 Tax=Bacillus cereus TaxID=1396 RepID=UPI000BF423A4|nr:hypothetical protein [Bacillus cereus]MCU5670775.1 hypothetical protein [Bacillus cereus]MDF9653352.1 hypothetical protein [Bacillus cereus]MDK7480502.1 hypothetical protein [Bacillus cereus]MDZ4424215.1 hypothetical protein [Bacillus cereus]PEQ64296.1 hypothetical protein CN470_06550 [Bacillus cereus]